VTIVVCEPCGAVQEITTPSGFVCASCRAELWYVRCPDCGRPMQWDADGPRRQRHPVCGTVVRLSRALPAPDVEVGVLADPAAPWWRWSAAGLPMALGEAAYLGGHPSAPAPVPAATVELQPDRVCVGWDAGGFAVPWSDVRAVHADTPDALAARPAVARMVAARAVDLEGASAASYLVVETDGEALVFGFETSQPELASRCRPVLTDASVGDDPADTPRLLRELARLHAVGVLSAAEFATRKAELLRRL